MLTLKPEFKKGVCFQYHNLAKHPFPSMLHNLFAFDVILCRNVMIYFSPPDIERIIGNMRQCLVDGGWLLVGHAEHNLQRFRDFRTANYDGAIAYQRVEGPNPATPSLPQLDSSCGSSKPLPKTFYPVLSRSHDRDASTSCEDQPTTECSVQFPRRPDTPLHVEPPSELAHIRNLADRGEIEIAEAQCQQLLKTNKLNPICHLYHALILGQLRQHSLCEQALRRAIYLDRNFVLAHYYLGLTFRRLGRHAADAERSFHNARQLLAALEPDHVIEDSDGLTVAELDQLTQMQLETVES